MARPTGSRSMRRASDNPHVGEPRPPIEPTTNTENVHNAQNDNVMNEDKTMANEQFGRGFDDAERYAYEQRNNTPPPTEQIPLEAYANDMTRGDDVDDFDNAQPHQNNAQPHQNQNVHNAQFSEPSTARPTNNNDDYKAVVQKATEIFNNATDKEKESYINYAFRTNHIKDETKLNKAQEKIDKSKQALEQGNENVLLWNFAHRIVSSHEFQLKQKQEKQANQEQNATIDVSAEPKGTDPTPPTQAPTQEPQVTVQAEKVEQSTPTQQQDKDNQEPQNTFAFFNIPSSLDENATTEQKNIREATISQRADNWSFDDTRLLAKTLLDNDFVKGVKEHYKDDLEDTLFKISSLDEKQLTNQQQGFVKTYVSTLVEDSANLIVDENDIKPLPDNEKTKEQEKELDDKENNKKQTFEYEARPVYKDGQELPSMTIGEALIIMAIHMSKASQAYEKAGRGNEVEDLKENAVKILEKELNDENLDPEFKKQTMDNPLVKDLSLAVDEKPKLYSQDFDVPEYVNGHELISKKDLENIDKDMDRMTQKFIEDIDKKTAERIEAGEMTQEDNTPQYQQDELMKSFEKANSIGTKYDISEDMQKLKADKPDEYMDKLKTRINVERANLLIDERHPTSLIDEQLNNLNNQHDMANMFDKDKRANYDKEIVMLESMKTIGNAHKQASKGLAVDDGALTQAWHDFTANRNDVLGAWDREKEENMSSTVKERLDHKKDIVNVFEMQVISDTSKNLKVDDTNISQLFDKLFNQKKEVTNNQSSSLSLSM